MAESRNQFPPRPPNFANSSSHQRDAAFSSIFGAAPPGRSQTMTSQSMQPPSDRAQTMSGHPGQVPRRPLPMRQQPGPPNGQMPNGYPHPNGHPQRPYQEMPPQNYPQNVPWPDRRQFAPRPDPRSQNPQQPYSRPPPPRPYPGPAPALNSTSYRTQSLVSMPRPQPPQFAGIHNQPVAPVPPPAHTWRQQPYMNQAVRTTAQGRQIPERQDERTMSLSSFARDSDYSQTAMGRVIAPRRRESGPAATFASPQPTSLPPPMEYREPEIQRPPPAPIQQSPPPATPGPLKQRTPSQDSQSSRTMSMQSTIAPSDITDSTAVSRPAVSKSNSQSTGRISRRRAPLVYPALLSRVADAFRERIGLADREKDGLVYKSAFTGAEAVDLIAYIMQTNDRNLALLLGRSLDAQKFFHDVTYDHRLRDSHSEVYQFRETLLEDSSDVNGVFTLTTECYSPTCTPDRLCYSIACPKRVDQQKRLNMKARPGLKREESRTSLHEEQGNEQKLWINTVSREVSDSVSDMEKKRQEIISELMYTERDFVKDLEYLRDFWMKPLRSLNPSKPSPIPEKRREQFIRTVFSNCQEVYAVNSRLAEALTRRQQQGPVVRNVGDIFLEYVPRFGPFITYGSTQLFGKYEFEKEKASNVAFSRFVDETERLKESRKLELNGYLTKPTTRLARYPLLLEGMLKYTADDNPDKKDIPKAIVGIRDVLSRVNIESGKAENRFTLLQLNQQLSWRNNEYVDLKLTEESRQLVFKGVLKKGPTDTTGDIHTYLFDHAVLFVRVKVVNKRDDLKVYKRPIPLELLVVTQMDELNPRLGLAKRPSSSLIPGSRSSTQDQTKQQGIPLTFRSLGKGSYDLTLYCTTQIQREKWLKLIQTQQNSLRERSNVFTKTILSEGFFSAANKINCCVPIDGGRKLVVGTDSGVYVTERKLKDTAMRPRRALDAKNVTQIDVLEQHSILLVLSDKNLYSYALEALDLEDSPMNPIKRGKKIAHANFFKIGVFEAQHLVCCVKTSALSTRIKIFKPAESMTSAKKKSGFAKMLAAGQEVLKMYKEFYIPSETYSIHFLRSTLCVGCARGFEIVTLDTLVTQPILDQADTSLDFVAMKENLKPIYVERLGRDFLLSYQEFSFFVNRYGWRTRSDWKIMWEGTPTDFAIFQPYILAFEPSFIEMRHLETGMLVYILTAENVRMLHSSTREILYAYEDESGADVIASLDFWGRPQQH